MTGIPRFKTAKELQAKIDKYFKNCPDTKKIVTKSGEVVEIPTPTICGLCLYCGFESRQSFYDYEKRPAFSYTVKRARLFIEKEYEQMLQGQSCTGAIFALKNLGWIDKTSQEITGKDGEPLTTVKKVYVTKADIKAVDDEIDRVINE